MMKRLTVISLLSIIFAVWMTQAAKLAQDGPPGVIYRKMWGARSPKKTPENLKLNPPPYVIIHHSDTDGCTSQAICNARVRSIQNYHMDHNNWDDIGYNFLIGEDGNIYEGRGWGVRGAHSPDYNMKSIGICFIGNFTVRVPGREAIKAGKNLLEYGVTAGKLTENYILLGHRQTRATTCPGDKFYELIQTWPHWSRTL